MKTLKSSFYREISIHRLFEPISLAKTVDELLNAIIDKSFNTFEEKVKFLIMYSLKGFSDLPEEKKNDYPYQKYTANLPCSNDPSLAIGDSEWTYEKEMSVDEAVRYFNQHKDTEVYTEVDLCMTLCNKNGKISFIGETQPAVKLVIYAGEPQYDDKDNFIRAVPRNYFIELNFYPNYKLVAKALENILYDEHSCLEELIMPFAKH